jgi:hypothetical protein
LQKSGRQSGRRGRRCAEARRRRDRWRSIAVTARSGPPGPCSPRWASASSRGRDGRGRKALIFTESRRTQDYLKTFLESNGCGGQVVLFNGTNGGPEATAIYERWVEKNRDTGRASGSRAVDVRTALIEHFRDERSILLATEAAAEGINLRSSARWSSTTTCPGIRSALSSVSAAVTAKGRSTKWS